ncbi:hypothetical protein [Kitasatospora sp. NPDC050543]|uniref:hypothetical protein n=1 Tax=Kitasatospora sp. NPDC050543 TaxID=3364054 RepID=UPI0037AE6A2F
MLTPPRAAAGGGAAGGAPRRRGEGSAGLTSALAVFAVGGLFGLVFANAYLGGLAGFGLGALYAVVLSAGLVVAAGAETGCWTAFLVLIAALIAAAAGSSAREDLILLSGRTVTATVVGKSMGPVSKGHADWYYTLRGPDGTTVPGGRLKLSEDGLATGDQVTVREDPAGRATPNAPDRVNPDGSLWTAAGLSGAIALAVLYAGLTRRRALRAGAGPPPEGHN